MKSFKEIALEDKINERVNTFRLNKKEIEFDNRFIKDRAINILLKAGVKDQHLEKQLDSRIENLTFDSIEKASECFDLLIKSDIAKISFKDADKYTEQLFKDIQALTKKGYKIRQNATNGIVILSPDGMATARLNISPDYNF